MTHARPYTCDSLADRWGCSAETIRQMVVTGRLPGFRVGRMIRIPATVVDEVEQCQKSASDGSGEASAPTGTAAMASGDVISLRHAVERKPRQRR